MVKYQTRSLLAILWCLFVSSIPALAQTSIQGSVVDADTGSPLPGATIQIDGSFVGTISNEEGNFSLQVGTFPASLVVRFIGYQSQSVTLSAAPTEPIRIGLAASNLELPELVITGENPAINIMRRVIEEKQKWQASFDTYQVNAYNRFRIENDSGIVSIWESSTVAYWDSERGTREISLTQKQTANTQIDELLPAALFMNNFYDDDVEIAGHRLMGVTNQDALSYYDFSLAGTRAIDNQLVYDINVEPRSKLGSGFQGTVAVLDSVYALLSVELEPGASFLFPLPIERLAVNYKQQFSRFGSNVWLPVDLRSSIALDVAFGALLSFPTFRIEQFTRLSGFELNVPVPDSLYATDNVVAADSAFIATVPTARLEDLAIPLTRDELDAYEDIDSTMSLEQAFKPRGLFGRLVDVNSNASGSGSSSNRGGGNGLIPDGLNLELTPNVWYNQVEGWHLGLTPTLRVMDRVALRGIAGYQAERKSWSYGGSLLTRGKVGLELGYRDHISPRYTSAVLGRFFNTIQVLTSQPDYYDYLHERVGYISLTTRIPGWNDASVGVRFSSVKHGSVARSISKGWLGTPDVIIANADIDAGSLQSVLVGFRYNGDSIPFGVGGSYAARFDVERSVGGSVVDPGHFTRFTGDITWRIPTFYRRRLLPNTLDFRVVAGSYSGRLPRQRFGIIDGSTFMTPFGGLRTRHDRPYEGESFAALFVEHSFRTILFERLGLRRIVEYGWNLILTGAVAQTWISGSRQQRFSPLPDLIPEVHSEIGISLSGLFGILRIDYARRLDKSDYGMGISVARMF